MNLFADGVLIATQSTGGNNMPNLAPLSVGGGFQSGLPAFPQPGYYYNVSVLFIIDEIYQFCRFTKEQAN